MLYKIYHMSSVYILLSFSVKAVVNHTYYYYYYEQYFHLHESYYITLVLYVDHEGSVRRVDSTILQIVVFSYF